MSGSSVAAEMAQDHPSSSNGNLKRAFREEELRNGGCKFSKRDAKNRIFDQFDDIVVRVFWGMESEAAAAFLMAANDKVMDVKKNVVLTLRSVAYDPSELRLSWGCTNLRDDVLLSSLGRPKLDLRVAVVIARSHDIARQVRVASIGVRGECLGAAFEELCAIIEPVSEDSVEDIKSLARSLAERALNDQSQAFHIEHYISLLQTLSNRWYRSTGALSERHVVISLTEHIEYELKRVFSALVDADCKGNCSSPLMRVRLMTLTKFIGLLFRHKLFHMVHITAILYEFDNMQTYCDVQVCACELLQVVCAQSNFALGRLVRYWTKFDKALNHLPRSSNATTVLPATDYGAGLPPSSFRFTRGSQYTAS